MVAGKSGLEWGRCEGKIALILILILFIVFSGKGFSCFASAIPAFHAIAFFIFSSFSE
jgi:hypothetical protein